MSPVVELVDEVVLPEAEVERWCDRWREEYLPGARQRGMTPASVARAHGAGGSCIMRITWRLPEPSAFYAMRSAAKADLEVAGFWEATDAVALDRHRQAFMLEDAS